MAITARHVRRRRSGEWVTPSFGVSAPRPSQDATKGSLAERGLLYTLPRV
ncbi:hypothetical protein IMZ48_21440 [Candidatus Bathyarchaeota archaeon]|nr:hypothetical protein [Candidatus Bathyarchaeota archaeon]